MIPITEYKVLGKLPNLFQFDDGRTVKSVEDWRERRKELIKTAVDLQFGGMPPEPEFLEVLPCYLSYSPNHKDAYRITTGTRAHPISFMMYVDTPDKCEPNLPAIVDGDNCWHKAFRDEIRAEVGHHQYLYVSFDRTELAVDSTALGRVGPIYDCYPNMSFSVISAWAWGYSRCVDALEILGIADMKHIAFTGLSRGAKTALLAGAMDERAFLVNPEATCAGGAGCYRLHLKALTDKGNEARSETLKDIYGNFPQWFTPELAEYADREEELPFDAHFLKALVAPRWLFISEAESDIWSNPVGSYLTTEAAEEVYRMYGCDERIQWYYRKGYHGQNIEDYQMLLNLMDVAIKGAPLDPRFRVLPFDKPEPIFDWRWEK